MLTKWKFRFFDSDSSEYGSYLITPSWHWFPLRVEGGATVCSFQMSVEENALCLSPISDIPPVHVNISRDLDGMLTSPQDSVSKSTVPSLSSLGILESAAVQQYEFETNLFSESYVIDGSDSLIECIMSHSDPNPSCCVGSGPTFNLSTVAVNQSLRKFSRQQLQ